MDAIFHQFYVCGIFIKFSGINNHVLYCKNELQFLSYIQLFSVLAPSLSLKQFIQLSRIDKSKFLILICQETNIFRTDSFDKTSYHWIKIWCLLYSLQYVRISRTTTSESPVDNIVSSQIGASDLGKVKYNLVLVAVQQINLTTTKSENQYVFEVGQPCKVQSTSRKFSCYCICIINGQSINHAYCKHMHMSVIEQASGMNSNVNYENRMHSDSPQNSQLDILHKSHVCTTKPAYIDISNVAVHTAAVTLNCQ